MISEMNEFLGEKLSYWSELKHRAESLDVVDLVREVSILRAKVSFYEKRIDDMAGFMKANFEIKNIRPDELGGD